MQSAHGPDGSSDLIELWSQFVFGTLLCKFNTPCYYSTQIPAAHSTTIRQFGKYIKINYVIFF